MKVNTSKDLQFSNKNRAERIEVAKNINYELIVVGGGITGVGIALDAALRGIKTLLLEKRDYASGTSSKSTKLIHGGLRYLKQLDFGLVRESGLERAIAHRNAPHLVHPENMLLPIVRGGTFNKYSASLAISVYDMLAKVEKQDRKKTHNKNQTLAYEPLLNQEILKSGITYSEYRTDDARLTIEVLKAARREGAESFNYMKVDSFVYQDDQIVGVNCLDRITDEPITFRGDNIVSATGPWADKVRLKDGTLNDKSLRLTKGVHIVVPKEKLNIHSAVYFDAFDGRMLFAVPRGNVTYIGTSDTNYDKDLDRVLCTEEDVEYLLEKTNHMFEVAHVSKEDVISSWAGLRPLIHEEGKSPSELSRKDEIFVSDRGLVSIAGGKLTGYRKMAKRIVDLIQSRDSKLKKTRCKTKRYRLHVDGFDNYKEYRRYYNQLHEKYDTYGVSNYQCWYLTTTYGKNAESILKTASLNEELSIAKAIIKAEITYTIEFESAIYPDDYFNRRSGKLYFDIYSLEKHFDFIVDEYAKHFEWTAEEKNFQRSKCVSLIDDVRILRKEELV